MFRRKRTAADPNEPALSAASGDEAVAADADAEVGADAGEAAEAVPAPPGPPQGPWDVSDAPEDGLERVDLGPLLVPVAKGVELRLEVDASGKAVAANLTTQQGVAQLTAFAAPRTDGIWDDVRAEIRSGLSGAGGLSEERDGPFGTELYASVPAQAANGARVLTPARFWGVDGPRWFVRALITGQAASDPAAAAALAELVKRVHVSRDEEPRPVREPLPLVLPEALAEQAEKKAEELRHRQAHAQAQQQAATRAQQEAAQREISRRAQEAAAGGDRKTDQQADRETHQEPGTAT